MFCFFFFTLATITVLATYQYIPLCRSELLEASVNRCHLSLQSSYGITHDIDYRAEIHYWVVPNINHYAPTPSKIRDKIGPLLFDLCSNDGARSGCLGECLGQMRPLAWIWTARKQLHVPLWALASQGVSTWRLRLDEKHKVDVVGVESKGQSTKVAGGSWRGRLEVCVTVLWFIQSVQTTICYNISESQTDLWKCKTLPGNSICS